MLKPVQVMPDMEATQEHCSRVIQALAHDSALYQYDLEDLLVAQTKLQAQDRFGLSLQWERLSHLLQLLVPLAFDRWFRDQQALESGTI